MAENKSPDFLELANKKSGYDKTRLITYLIILTTVILSVGLLGILSDALFFWGGLLVIIPFYVSIFICIITILASKITPGNREIIHTFKMYYNPKSSIYGLMDVCKGVLKSIVIVMATAIIGSLLIPVILPSFYQNYTSSLNSLINEGSSMEEIYNYIFNDQEFVKVINRITTISLLTGTYYFILRCLKFLMNVALKDNAVGVSNRIGTMIFKRTFKVHWKLFYKFLFINTYFIIIPMFFICFGSATLCFVFNLDSYAFLISSVATILFTVPFLPYLVRVFFEFVAWHAYIFTDTREKMFVEFLEDLDHCPIDPELKDIFKKEVEAQIKEREEDAKKASKGKSKKSKPKDTKNKK